MTRSKENALGHNHPPCAGCLELAMGLLAREGRIDDLLAALKELLEWFPSSPHFDAIADKARAAIAKAEGGK